MQTYSETEKRTATTIWERIVKPDRSAMPPDVARFLLTLDFAPEDHARVDELSLKAQEGTLSVEERMELEEYLQINDTLTILQSKARRSLQANGPRD